MRSSEVAFSAIPRSEFRILKNTPLLVDFNMKNSSFLLASLASVGIFALYSFTGAPVRREKIPASVWRDFAKKKVVATTELGRPLPKMERDTNPPLQPRYDDFMQNTGGSGIDLHDPKAVEQSVDYDPMTDQYIITEKIGDDYFRAPTYMTFSEYMEWRAAKQQQDYFDKLAGVASGDRSASGAADPLAKFEVKRSLVDKLFGGTEVDIKPQGNIDLTFGMNYQKVANPVLPRRAQNPGPQFDFNMNIAMNATGKIGEKLNLAFNYNTQATFDFDNVMKLHYDPKAGFGDDDILQNIEAGNVSMPLRSQLIKGSQKLFGIKTELKFGRLRLTTVASQQQTKQQNLQVKGGGQIQQFNIPVDDYDENRHFFLSQYNRSTFEKSLRCLPTVQSLFKITKLQVWATNENNQVTTNRRDVVCLADLGEPKPYLTKWNGGVIPKDLAGLGLPDNGSNTLYGEVASDSAYRYSDKVVQNLNLSGLTQVQDYEKLNARLLDPNRDYTFHEDLGFISINLNVQTDHIIGAAFEYTYNGIRHQVGEFVDEVANQNNGMDTTAANFDLHQKVLFVKMLKPRTANVKYPIWDLMMKNVYAIGASQVEQNDFRFDILYENGKGERRFLSQEDDPGVTNPIANRPFLQVFHLDTLNQQRDPGPDGVFDFIPGLTINLRSGRVMFPVLEPFGDYLSHKLEPVPTADSVLIKKYCFFELYDSTVTAAREQLAKNRFTLRGQYKSQNSSEISLGAFNIPPGSVRVSGGGIQMVEGRDYEVDYNIGKVRILNDAVLQSGTPVNISFEDNNSFGFNQRTMLGVRADYEFSKNMSLGATWMDLFERPLTQKINIGDDPINNRMYGLDFNITKDAPWLTKAVDRIPGINTKAPSSITFQAEAALLDPGHSRAINTGLDKGGVVYLDDFEGSSSGYDLRTPYTAWTLASIPQGDGGSTGTNRWPESKLTDDLAINANRAKAVWYQADPSARSSDDTKNPYTRVINSEEIFPNRQLTPLDNSYLRPFDFTYYPDQRGQYNFDPPGGYPGISAGLETTAPLRLKDPTSRWAGIMRGVTTNDFEQANIEFVEFWMLNPFIEKPDDPGNVTNKGKLLIQLGTMSEDIIKDGTAFYENGLPTPKDPSVVTRPTNMGRVPFQQPVTNFFDNDPAARSAQDVGLDGLNDEAEQVKFNTWLNQVKGVLPAEYDKVFKDPSNDDFLYFRDNSWPATANLLTKYSQFNNSEANSPVNTGSSYVEASTTYPDIEDVNKDNTFNETESYYSYELPIENDLTGHLKYAGDPNIAPLITQVIERPDETDPALNRTWYRVKIPLNNTAIRKTVGGIQDFRSIQFIRIIAKEFDKRVTFRFATLELGRNQWRTYKHTLFAGGPTTACPDISPATSLATPFDVNSVNIEENSERQPFKYVLPPGIKRENSVGAFPDALQNEQSLSLSTCHLYPCDAKGIYKLLNLDMRQFGRMKMVVHAETVDPLVTMTPIWKAGDLRLFLRLGSDFTNNYYEYSIPLKPSDPAIGSTAPLKEYAANVWLNNIDFPLELLVELKKMRDKAGFGLDKIFAGTNPDVAGDSIKIIGNPSLGLVKGMMIGIKNASEKEQCAELWLNELRLTGINEESAYAGLARADVKLADFADVQMSTLYESGRWGSIEQKTLQRSLTEHLTFDVAANVALDKFLGEKSGVKIPFHTNYSSDIRNPIYDPQNLDVKLKDKLADAPSRAARREIKREAQDATVIKGFNFTNVRVESKKKKNLTPPWDISNFSVSYAYNVTDKRTPFIVSDNLKQYKGGLDYNWSFGLKPITPFKKAIKKDKYLKFISEFNFNPVPTSYGFNSTLERNKEVTTYRFPGTTTVSEDQSTFYNKRFTWDRNYDLSWDLTKSIKLSYDASAKTIIDELNPYAVDYTDQKNKAELWRNLKSGGRLKTFNQNMSGSYQLPFKLIPMMDWVQGKASVSAGYNWDAASLKVPSFGNTIQNNQTRQLNGDFNFETLYNKSKYLSKINKGTKAGGGGKGSGAPGGRTETGPPGGPGKGRSRDIGGGATLEGGDDAGGRTGKNKKGDPAGGMGDPSGRLDPSKPANGLEPSNNIPGGKFPSGRPGGPPGAPGGGLNPDGTPADPATAGGGKSDPKGGKDPKKKDEKKKERTPSTFERIAIRPLMTVRKARLGYTETRASVVPGFMPVAKFLGQDGSFNNPGWAFTLGNRPTGEWLDRNAAAGRMSTDVNMGSQVTRNFATNLDAAATLEPFQDFKIDLTASRQFQKNNTELFKVPDQYDTVFAHRAIRNLGSMTVSYYNMQTIWNKDIDGIFNNFEANRRIISQRLGIAEGNTAPHSEDPGYTYGYGKIQQQVLIPAFLSAYNKSDPNKIGLDVFKTMPRVNWKVQYNGLSKLKTFKSVFSSFSITHGYKSTMTVNSYQTDLQYNANDHAAGRTAELTGDYIARYEIPQLVLNEQFSPLLGIDMRFKNEMNFKVEMKKSRNLGMSFIDYQLAEQRTTDYTFQWGYKMKNVIIPFLQTKGQKAKLKKEKAAARKKKKTGEADPAPDPKAGAASGKPSSGQKGNDLKFDFSFSYRDDVTANHRLDSGQKAQRTRGATTYRINPTVDYALNKRLTVGLYFDMNKTIPKTSASYPITNIQSGVRVRFSLN